VYFPCLTWFSLFLALPQSTARRKKNLGTFLSYKNISNICICVCVRAIIISCVFLNSPFQTTRGPSLGQLLIEHSENQFVPISSFTQTDVNNGKIFYQHLKTSKGQKANDSIIFTASSRWVPQIFAVSTPFLHSQCIMHIGINFFQSLLLLSMKLMYFSVPDTFFFL